jgi:3-phenylpropionate/cinnamic acid dioxygenase small subunit
MKKILFFFAIPLFLMGCARQGEQTTPGQASPLAGKKPATWETLTDFQKRLQPQRLGMVQADNSGKPLPADPAVLADRLAIINHVTAYSFLIDEGRWDEWFSLFSDDILFETTAPCFGTVSVKGMKAFKKFVNIRFRGPGSETNAVAHRHTIGNVHVASQTDTTAEVRTYLLISNAHPDGSFYVFTSGTYNASLRKRNGRWTITRWYIETDAVVPKSEIPDDPNIKYIPDNRPMCDKK